MLLSYRRCHRLDIGTLNAAMNMVLVRARSLRTRPYGPISRLPWSSL